MSLFARNFIFIIFLILPAITNADATTCKEIFLTSGDQVSDLWRVGTPVQNVMHPGVLNNRNLGQHNDPGLASRVHGRRIKTVGQYSRSAGEVNVIGYWMIGREFVMDYKDANGDDLLVYFRVTGFTNDFKRDERGRLLESADFNRAKILITRVGDSEYTISDPTDKDAVVSLPTDENGEDATDEDADGRADKDTTASKADQAARVNKKIQDLLSTNGIDIRPGTETDYIFMESNRLIRLAKEPSIKQRDDFDLPAHLQQYVPRPSSREESEKIRKLNIELSTLRSQMGRGELEATIEFRSYINEFEERLEANNFSGAESSARKIYGDMIRLIEEIRDLKRNISQDAYISTESSTGNKITAAENKRRDIRKLYRREVRLGRTIKQYDMFWERVKKRLASPNTTNIMREQIIRIIEKIQRSAWSNQAPTYMEILYHAYSSSISEVARLEQELNLQIAKREELNRATELGVAAQEIPALVTSAATPEFSRRATQFLNRFPLLNQAGGALQTEFIRNFHGKVLKFDIEDILLDMSLDDSYSELLLKSAKAYRGLIDESMVDEPVGEVEPVKTGYEIPGYTSEFINRRFGVRGIDRLDVEDADFEYFNRLMNHVYRVGSYDPVVVAFRAGYVDGRGAIWMKRMLRLAKTTGEGSVFEKFLEAEEMAKRLGPLNVNVNYEQTRDSDIQRPRRRMRIWGSVAAAVVLAIPAVWGDSLADFIKDSPLTPPIMVQGLEAMDRINEQVLTDLFTENPEGSEEDGPE